MLLLVACESDPRGVPPMDGLTERGEAMLRAGRSQEARVYFTTALRQDVHPFLPSIGLARAGLQLEDPRLFEAAITRAIATVPPTPEGYDLVGRTLLLGARRSEENLKHQYASMAGEYLGNARRIAPEIPELDHHLGVSHWLSHRPRAALPFFQAELRRNPDHGPALEGLVACLRALKQDAEIARLRRVYAERGPVPAALREDGSAPIPLLPEP